MSAWSTLILGTVANASKGETDSPRRHRRTVR